MAKIFFASSGASADALISSSPALKKAIIKARAIAKARSRKSSFCVKSTGKIPHNKTLLDGYTFDSASEADRYVYLKTLEKAGRISALCIHPGFTLQPGFKDRLGRARRAITYIADFSYEQEGLSIVEDVKSDFTAQDKVFRIKSKILCFQNPDMVFRAVKYHRGAWIEI